MLILKLLKQNNRKRSFTLIEALVAILILGIALGVMLATFVVGRVSVAMAKHHMEAMNHARAAMEQYIYNGTRTYTWPGDSDIENLNPSCFVDPTPYTGYGYGYGVTGYGVVVTISWNERRMGGGYGRASERLETYVIE